MVLLQSTKRSFTAKLLSSILPSQRHTHTSTIYQSANHQNQEATSSAEKPAAYLQPKVPEQKQLKIRRVAKMDDSYNTPQPRGLSVSDREQMQKRVQTLEYSLQQALDRNLPAWSHKKEYTRKSKYNKHIEEINALQAQLGITIRSYPPLEVKRFSKEEQELKYSTPQKPLSKNIGNGSGSKYGWGREEPVKESPQTPRHRDAVSAPSAASGGVPEPTQAYIEQASREPQLASETQHILVIIDLNGALIHRPDRKQPTRYIARNSTDLFLEYLFSRFQCMVWSAARPDNVNNMCSQLFPGSERRRLLAEWGRDRMGLSAADYNKRTQVYKRLETVWNDAYIQSRHPLAKYGYKWDQTNTVLIDDSREKGRSHPYNLIQVPEFEGQKESEDVLRAVAAYLDDLLVHKDVSAAINHKPFTFDEAPYKGSEQQSG